MMKGAGKPEIGRYNETRATRGEDGAMERRAAKHTWMAI